MRLKEQTPEEDVGTAVPQEGGETEEDEDEGSAIIPIVIAVCLVILVGGLAAVAGLHYKRKLPACFYK